MRWPPSAALTGRSSTQSCPAYKGWHGTFIKGGGLIQHAPVTARLAHGHSANPHGPGFESEGFAGEPLDEGQVGFRG